MKAVFLSCAVFSIFALLAIAAFLFASGAPFIAKIGFTEFVFGKEWAPLADEPTYGILNMIVASLYVTALAVIIGVGIGLLTAVCLYKFCPKKLVAPVRHMINLLAGIPSVIFGLFGMVIIVPFVRDYISPTGVGYGIFTASIVLGIMVLPTIVSVSLDALNSVPETYYEGALALGATKEQATFKVMMPAAKSGIFAGIVLAIGRAIGETMAVIMVIGNSPEMPNSLFQSVRTMTANIAMSATELTQDALSALIATGVILFVFALLLNISFSLLKDAGSFKAGSRVKRLGAKHRALGYAQPYVREAPEGEQSEFARNAERNAKSNFQQIIMDKSQVQTADIRADEILKSDIYGTTAQNTEASAKTLVRGKGEAVSHGLKGDESNA